jgi:arsenate reductase
MTLKIYYNPRCSKSRKTLEIIRGADVDPDIVLYLQDTPDATEILDVAGKLGVAVADLLRRGESTFKEAADLPDLADDAALARPIVVDTASGKAVVGRPPENVEALLR